MKKFLTTLCAAAISVSFAGTAVAQTAAGGVQFVAPPASQEARAIQVQGPGEGPRWKRGGGRHFDGRRHFRDDRHFRGRIPHYRGHRGYHSHRPGYRRHGEFWYPAAAFIAGALITGAINNNRGSVYRGGSAHIQWCYDRYRSYRSSDNTFQPYNGPRQQCYSPYS